MIFLTVGTQLPFDRLVKWMDDYCQENLDIECFGQIGNGGYFPSNFHTVNRLDFTEFNEAFEQANLVVAHAGMGTILTSLCEGKKLLIVPRRYEYNEHRNNHQVGTSERFSKFPNCVKADNYTDFVNGLDFLRKNTTSKAGFIPKFAPASTINSLVKVLED